ncbi:Cys-tRNA(Pro) deacylase, prolyl-tRNA editing enzyme YbaK/EbsC [Streptomyces sp. DI166]|uniref:aminoacyl-tRNA deacylase n=1 Tax=Streptomyces sp. DI166 TaxID=1839783 RepID=UPI0007F55192|nr:YbaK/EbsC family protein [Streptomyces sp. DI166]SBT94229.1 Cys-tRNA(Pro) deacylase, prolyl-tRNA editing enzyme YbaK/EbsC [Streptomyces sp. DI166]
MSAAVPPWRAVLDAHGCAYVVHEHAAAHTVAERRALPFPWSQAVKTLAFTAPEVPLLLVALRAPDRVDFARLAAAVGTSRSGLRTADAELLAAEGLVPGGIPPVSHRPGVPCLIDVAVGEPDRPVYCGGGSPARTLRIASGALAALPRARTVHVAREPNPHG